MKVKKTQKTAAQPRSWLGRKYDATKAAVIAKFAKAEPKVQLTAFNDAVLALAAVEQQVKAVEQKLDGLAPATRWALMGVSYVRRAEARAAVVGLRELLVPGLSLPLAE